MNRMKGMLWIDLGACVDTLFLLRFFAATACGAWNHAAKSINTYCLIVLCHLVERACFSLLEPNGNDMNERIDYNFMEETEVPENEKKNTTTDTGGGAAARTGRGAASRGGRRRRPQTAPKAVAPAEQTSAAPHPQAANAEKQRTGQKRHAPRPQQSAAAPQPQAANTEKQSAGQKRRAPRPQQQGAGPAKQQPKGDGRAKGENPPAQAAPQPAPKKQQQEAGAPAKKSASQRRRGKKSNKQKLRVIPLGGLGEVGKNITVYEYGNDAFLVDCGLTFPDESMPGVDLVIPDFTYVIENKDRIQGIMVTHGHEDHIGAIPYLLKQVNLPIYGTRLTLGLIEGKLREHGLLNKAKLNLVKPGDFVQFGSMNVECINVNHSIPDACAFAIHTPLGVVVHTGDFKIDLTPIAGDPINLGRFGELGAKGVLALMSESTNAERPGSTPSERTVGESFDKLFAAAASSRILVATFASNVHRVQQIVDAAVKYKRKVAVSGRSMENVMGKALELGYLDVPSGVLIEIDAINRYLPEQTVIITTGSQGEPMSALSRMATGEHRKVQVNADDCIIISATPIPGNEKTVTRVINDLLKLGARVVYEKMYDIHVSGHACQEELKMMMALTKPKFFVPIHGEFKHMKKHAELAHRMGIDGKNILITNIGRVIEIDQDGIAETASVPAGKVMVDGIGVGDVGSIVLRDRKHLSEDGLIVIVAAVDMAKGVISAGPDVVSRGFVYVRESEDMMARAREISRNTILKCLSNNTREWGVIKQKLRDDVGDYIWHITKRNPIILPVIQEVRR